MTNKIVVVDDDIVTLTMLDRVLRERGYQVIVSQDGSEGYELIQKEKPDIVISDMLIPKIHGLDLCKKIKEISELKQTKVILMTAVYKGVPFQADIKECGADDFIEKPINMQDLMNRIDKFLGKEEKDIKSDTDNNSID